MTEATAPETITAELADVVATTVEPALAERIERARVRSAELAASASTRAREFVHDHPVASVAGGIVLGALVAGALSRLRPRPVPVTLVDKAESTLEEAGARLSRLAALGAELALTYAARAASAGKDGAEKIEERLSKKLGEISETASEKGSEASHKLAGLAEVVLATLRSRLNKIRPD
jgi:hypothetical protein